LALPVLIAVDLGNPSAHSLSSVDPYNLVAPLGVSAGQIAAISKIEKALESIRL